MQHWRRQRAGPLEQRFAGMAGNRFARGIAKADQFMPSGTFLGFCCLAHSTRENRWRYGDRHAGPSRQIAASRQFGGEPHFHPGGGGGYPESFGGAPRMGGLKGRTAVTRKVNSPPEMPPLSDLPPDHMDPNIAMGGGAMMGNMMGGGGGGGQMGGGPMKGDMMGLKRGGGGMEGAYGQRAMPYPNPQQYMFNKRAQLSTGPSPPEVS